MKTTQNLLIFGGSSARMNKVKSYLSQIENIEITEVFNEEDGIKKLELSDKNLFDLILIGGRYTNEQRDRIKLSANKTPITQPGIDYPYSDENIYLHINKLLHPKN